MSYNRWTESDYLAHHGVKGQVWGHKNGPPYPLSRQDKFRTVGPDGRPITSKIAYKKAQKNVRAANRVERKANPNGTPQDKKERNSFGAQIKRKYRQYKRDLKAKAAEKERIEAEQKEKERTDYEKQIKRLSDLNVSEETRKAIFSEAEDYHKTNDYNRADALEAALDLYERRRGSAKEHGTAEEVMKYRDTFNKDEWNEIAGRLEAEARVRKLLDRPLDSANSNQNQGKNQNQSKSQETAESGLSGKLKKIAEKGDAREVYQNRAKFTPEQLQTISRRLEAEETIGKFADNQLLFKSDTLRNLENVARYAQTAGKIATGISTITKAFSGGGNNGQQQSSGKSNKGKDNGGNVNEKLDKLGEKFKEKGLRYTGGDITANAHLVERLNEKKKKK